MLEKEKVQKLLDHTYVTFNSFFDNFSDETQCVDFLEFAYTSNLLQVSEKGNFQKLFEQTLTKLNQFIDNFTLDIQCTDFLEFASTSNALQLLEADNFQALLDHILPKADAYIADISSSMNISAFCRTQGYRPSADDKEQMDFLNKRR